LYAQVRLGADPAAEKAEAKVKAAETFEAAVRAYLARQRTRLRPRSYAEVERHLLVTAKSLHGLALTGVHRRDAANLLNSIEDKSGPIAANRARTTISALYSWAIKNGMAEANPIIGTEQRPEQSRDRVLSPDELELIWNTLVADHYGSILKLLALTAQRRDEIAGLRWREIDFEAATITLPHERVKNNRQHTIPLSTPALAILEAQPRRAGREMVFGFGNGPFSNWSRAKQHHHTRIAEMHGQPLPHWTPHDLRRTAATSMAELGIQPHVIEAVLGHISGHRSGVAGIYNRATYDREKRDALNLWAGHLLAIVEGREPVVLPPKRA
jgi:integrase